MPQVKNGKVTISWQSHGRDDGEPVVMIMGMVMSSRGWHRLLPHIDGKFRVITFDNRGTGGSDRPLKPFKMEDMVADTIAVMDAAGLNDAHIVGASLGGMVAQRLALKYPERVRSLALACTSASQNGAAGRDIKTTLALIFRPLLGVKRSFPLIVPSLYSKKTIEMHYERIEEDMRQRMSENLPLRTAYCQTLIAMRHDSRNLLHKIKMPTIIVHGEDDGILTSKCALELAKHIPHAELVLVPDAGHIMITDREQQVAKVMIDFITDNSTSYEVRKTDIEELVMA